jgi:hypothetical protein
LCEAAPRPRPRARAGMSTLPGRTNSPASALRAVRERLSIAEHYPSGSAVHMKGTAGRVPSEITATPMQAARRLTSRGLCVTREGTRPDSDRDTLVGIAASAHAAEANRTAPDQPWKPAFEVAAVALASAAYSDWTPAPSLTAGWHRIRLRAPSMPRAIAAPGAPARQPGHAEVRRVYPAPCQARQSVANPGRMRHEARDNSRTDSLDQRHILS